MKNKNLEFNIQQNMKKEDLAQLDCDLLPYISSPADIRDFSVEKLNQLAAEIRFYMLDVVSKNGGHLAPNLGVVELTLALHSSFNTPDDKIIWDVGHQCYTHKIITGRRDEFTSLRSYGGLSGFPKRQESCYDCFDTGHSSTSISAALAFAKARDLSGEKHEVLAVIGDGALTGGLAYEGLNQAGAQKSKLIVVLNDNKMSINKNVGAMSNYLVRMRTNPRYTKTKRDLETFIRSIPYVGVHIAENLYRLKGSFKYLLVSGMLFEELGYFYLGPIDGHDIEALKRVFERAKNINQPTLIHVITQKGHGYAPAEKNPDKFHGVGPFDLETGLPLKNSGKHCYTNVFSDALIKLGEADPKILAITAAMADGTGVGNFAERFPVRAFDVGIAEQHAVTFAAGLAAEGFRPVVAIYSSFLQRAYDQILHDVCLQNLPVTFAIDRAGLVGKDGPTHHGVFDLSYLRTMPNMLLMAPKDENELQHMLATALAYNGPAALRYPKGNGQNVDLDEIMRPLPIGKGEVLRDGRDVCLFACGSMVYPAMEAADILKTQGVEAMVVNARFVVPLDKDLLLLAARKTGKILTIEENVENGGFGSACLETLSELGVDAQLEIAALPNSTIPHGDNAILLDKYGLCGEKLAQRVMNCWFKNSPLKISAH